MFIYILLGAIVFVIFCLWANRSINQRMKEEERQDEIYRKRQIEYRKRQEESELETWNDFNEISSKLNNLPRSDCSAYYINVYTMKDEPCKYRVQLVNKSTICMADMPDFKSSVIMEFRGSYSECVQYIFDSLLKIFNNTEIGDSAKYLLRFNL